MKVAYLGLGIMGHGMASNLVKAGHEVSAWNRSAGKAVNGARMAKSPAEAAAGAEVVWMCVADTKAVEQVLFGAEGVEQSLRSGMIIADSSTISPEATRRFAERVRQRGVDYVDAPVTGSKVGAENGQLTFMVGASDESMQRLDPLFRAMGKTVLHIGETGKGQSIKICGNLMIASIFEGFVEALTLAKKLGVAPEKVLSLISASMIRSGVVEYKAPFVLQRDFSPNFPLRLMHKDLRLMLEAAQQTGVKLPATETIEKVYAQAETEGHSEQDYAATLLLLEKWAGLNGDGKART